MQTISSLPTRSPEGSVLNKSAFYETCWSAHAYERMIERQISAADVHEVLQRPESLEHGDRPELINLRSTVRGRALRVTVNALTDCIVTIAEDKHHSCSSAFGWFTLGAAIDEQF